MKAAFYTLGCKVNQYETEAIKEAFVSRGVMMADEEEIAEIYVINTCTVTSIADRKSRQFIRRAKRKNPDAVVVATGCYAQVAAKEINQMPEVDLIIGNDLKSEIAERTLRYIASKGEAREISEGKRPTEGITNCDSSLGSELSCVLPFNQLNEYEDMGLVTSDESSMCRAYIKIEDGCDRFCSYCLIPYARGTVRSRAPESITREAEVLIDRGFKEIILTGINTALYGREEDFSFKRMPDEEGMNGLEVIIKRLDELEGDFRIRLSSLEPTVVDASDVKKLLGYDKLCHHLHLSAQSGSDNILKSMNRRYNREEYLEIVRAIREFDPLFGITTDIIVGFPGETDDDFDESLELVRSAGFARVHAFRYSPRKGTAGAGLPDRVGGDVCAARMDEIERVADEASIRFIESNIGRVHTMLVEEEQDGYLTGYTDNYIKVYIKKVSHQGISHRNDDCKEMPNARESMTENPRLGDFCKVQLIEAYKDGCRAEPAYRIGGEK